MRAALLCLALIAGGSVAAPDQVGSHRGDMSRYEMPGYTLVAADSPQLRRDMAKLPRLNRALELALGVSTRPTGIPTRVYVVSSSMWSRYLQLGPGIVSEFVPTRFRNYIIADTSRIDRDSLFHEHAHLFLYMQAGRIYPHWFDEGFAQLMGKAQYTATTARYFPFERRDEDNDNWISIERVLRADRDSPDYLNRGTRDAFYFEALSMTYRALIDDPKFGKQVEAYIEALNQLQSPEQAQGHFGVDLDGLNYQMRAWVNRSNKDDAKMALGDIQEQPLPDGTPLSKLEVLLDIAEVSLDTGLGLDRLDELLTAAAREPGGAPRTLVPWARLSAKLMQDKPIFEVLRYAGPRRLREPQIARGIGLALFERVVTLDQKPVTPAEAATLMNRSFELLDRSLEANPDDPEAAWAYATLAAGLKKDLDVAMKRLLPMFDRLPRNPDLAHAAALVQAARGDPGVRQYYQAVFQFAHSLDEKQWAAAQLRALDLDAPAVNGK
jgi:tetratricopeptide (TPR) repeat protein